MEHYQYYKNAPAAADVEEDNSNSISQQVQAAFEASEVVDIVNQGVEIVSQNCQSTFIDEEEDAKLLISTLQELVEQMRMDAVLPSLPSNLNDATSSEDLKSLEPPADAQNTDGPKRFVFEEMKDFSPKGSFGFLALNSSYRAIFPQTGGTEVIHLLFLKILILILKG